MGKLIIEGNSVYEIDEECVHRRENQEKQRREIEGYDKEQYGRQRPQRN